MKNIYGLYKQTRDASWHFLIDNEIKALPLNVVDVCNQNGVSIIKNSSVNELKDGEIGVSVLHQNNWYIIYDDTAPKERVRYTIAHEMGHIYLGHPLKAGYHARIIDTDKPDTEWQAERFAIGILAPACVLWGLNLHTAEEIKAVCDISFSAAKIRAERMKLLYERDKFLISPLEKTVYNNFSEYINKNKNSSL